MDDLRRLRSGPLSAPIDPRLARVASVTARVCFALVSIVFSGLQWVILSRPAYALQYDSVARRAGFAHITANNCKYAITLSGLTLTYALVRNGPFRGLTVVVIGLSQLVQIPSTWTLADLTSPTVWGTKLGIICLGIGLTIGESIWISKCRATPNQDGERVTERTT